MAQTPSKRRRKGRNDFDPNTDPMDIQPYKEESWGYDMYLQDWLDGWYEAEKEYIKQEEEEITLQDLLERVIEIERKLNEGGIY